MGVTIKILATVSIKQPINKRSNITSAKKIAGLSETEVNHCPTKAATPCLAISHEKALDAEIIKRTMAVFTAALAKISMVLLKVNSL